MARTKRSSVRPRLQRASGKGPILIVNISTVTKRLLEDMRSIKGDDDKLKVVKSTIKSLERAIVDGRFYHDLEKYVLCIQNVGIKFDAMVQAYVNKITRTRPSCDPAYFDMVEHISVLMHDACTLMHKCLRVHQDDVHDLWSLCSESKDTICNMHNDMLHV